MPAGKTPLDDSGARPHLPEAEHAVPPYTVLFLLGAGHSGSTLLNFLLNGHSQAIGLCEIHTIQRYLRLPPDDPRNPLSHPFWREVASCWERETNTLFADLDLRSPSRKEASAWSDSERAGYVARNRRLFACAARVSGARVLVDSSHHRWRLWLLRSSGELDLKVVHLLRDGRALVNSYTRKYGRFSIGFRRWFVPTLMGLWLRRRLSEHECLVVRYEDLASDPEPTLRRICRFVGLEYEPAMLRYWEFEDVAIGGNRMRQRKQPVRLDDRWRRELSPLHRLMFLLAGGWLNALAGYPPWTGSPRQGGSPSSYPDQGR